MFLVVDAKTEGIIYSVMQSLNKQQPLELRELEEIVGIGIKASKVASECILKE